MIWYKTIVIKLVYDIRIHKLLSGKHREFRNRSTYIWKHWFIAKWCYRSVKRGPSFQYMAWRITLSIWKTMKLDSQIQMGKKLKCYKLTIIIKFNYKTKNYKYRSRIQERSWRKTKTVEEMKIRIWRSTRGKWWCGKQRS